MTVDMPVACHETNRTECFVPKPKFYADNGTAEVAAADRYANKIFMIKAVSSKYEVVNKPHWQTASSDTGYLSFPGAYSAVCWYTGKALFEKLGGDTPVGLLQTSVGGYVFALANMHTNFLLSFFFFFFVLPNAIPNAENADKQMMGDDVVALHMTKGHLLNTGCLPHPAHTRPSTETPVSMTYRSATTNSTTLPSSPT